MVPIEINAFGIQPLRTCLTMQKVDVLPGEAGLKQRIDGGMGGGCIGDGAHDAIHRIRDKVPSFCRVGFHDVSPTLVDHRLRSGALLHSVMMRRTSSRSAGDGSPKPRPYPPSHTLPPSGRLSINRLVGTSLRPWAGL